MVTTFSLSRGDFSQRINGFDMYCEVAGTGPLLMWLPGAFAGVDRLRTLVDSFRQQFRVLTADANGQGRSSLGPGPITYVSMTADMVSLMDKLSITDVMPNEILNPKSPALRTARLLTVLPNPGAPGTVEFSMIMWKWVDTSVTPPAIRKVDNHHA